MSIPAILRRHRPAPLLSAMVLLAALCAHLAFMVSPLHGAMAADEPHVAVGMQASGVAPALAVAPDHTGHHDGHCIMEWVRTERATGLGIGAAALTPYSPDAPPSLALTGSAIARTLIPAHTGDVQARLQVFRE